MRYFPHFDKNDCLYLIYPSVNIFWLFYNKINNSQLKR